MRTLRIIAADDEVLALRRLELLLARLPSVELMATARDGLESLHLIAELEPESFLRRIDLKASPNPKVSLPTTLSQRAKLLSNGLQRS